MFINFDKLNNSKTVKLRYLDLKNLQCEKVMTVEREIMHCMKKLIWKTCGSFLSGFKYKKCASCCVRHYETRATHRKKCTKY